MADDNEPVKLRLVEAPPPDKTDPAHYKRLDVLRGVFDERKIIGVGLVAIDEEGRCHTLSSFDMCRQTALLGGLEYLKVVIANELDKEMMPRVPDPEGEKS